MKKTMKFHPFGTIIFSAIILSLFSPTAFCQVNWIQQNSNTTAILWAIQFLDANNGYACGETGTVVKTTDGGTTWFAVNISTPNPVKDIFFITASEGWAAVGDVNNSTGSGEIWHTIDGGLSWAQQTPSTTEARLGVAMASSSTGWVVGSKNGPLNIDATVNGGTNWTNQTDANIFGWTYKIDALSATTAFVIGRAFFPSVTGFIIKTANGGNTWTQNNTGTIPFLNGMDMVNADTGFVAGDAGTIMTTTDGGTSWTNQTSGTTDTLEDVSFVSSSSGWACGFSGTIRRTVDGGSNWTGETSGVPEALHSVFALDTTTVWAAGSNGKIIKRTVGTGIAENNNAFSGTVNIFPNPSHSEIVFDLTPFVSGKESLRLKIYSADGKEIAAVNNIIGSSCRISTGGFSKGTYLYVLQSRKRNLVSGKLVIE